ncbi:MAG: hypothetical protein FWE54_05200 [Methanimicrococcus sp.]|nr:hypothetical protein [Methanimicrococcus sp.]
MRLNFNIGFRRLSVFRIWLMLTGKGGAFLEPFCSATEHRFVLSFCGDICHITFYQLIS